MESPILLPLYPFLGDLVRTYPSPMTVQDTHTGRYVLANAAAAQRYGLTPETYCGLTFQEIEPTTKLIGRTH